MTVSRTTTTVAIVGGGASGLTLANLLQRNGVSCVVLKRQTRAYVEKRQRAGVVELRAIQMFEEWGLAGELFAGAPRGGTIEFRVDGESRLFHEDEHTGGLRSLICPQQILVQRLIGTFLAGGGDLRFEAEDVALHDLTGDRPRGQPRQRARRCPDRILLRLRHRPADHPGRQARAPVSALRGGERGFAARSTATRPSTSPQARTAPRTATPDLGSTAGATAADRGGRTTAAGATTGAGTVGPRRRPPPRWRRGGPERRR